MWSKRLTPTIVGKIASKYFVVVVIVVVVLYYNSILIILKYLYFLSIYI